jgi:hypothetical protein
MEMEGTLKELKPMEELSLLAFAYSNWIMVPNLVLFSNALAAGFWRQIPFFAIAAFAGGCSYPSASMPISEAADPKLNDRRIKVYKRKDTKAI